MDTVLLWAKKQEFKTSLKIPLKIAMPLKHNKRKLYIVDRNIFLQPYEYDVIGNTVVLMGLNINENN